MKPINSLPPFKRFCVTIGNLPSSYVDSMSYYECLMWLCKYLKDTVIPAVNENAEAVNELINWFNNLDVQDEIDNKLDKMVEDGTLEQMIGAYVDEYIAQTNIKLNKLENDIEINGKPVVLANDITYDLPDEYSDWYSQGIATSGDVLYIYIFKDDEGKLLAFNYKECTYVGEYEIYLHHGADLTIINDVMYVATYYDKNLVCIDLNNFNVTSIEVPIDENLITLVAKYDENNLIIFGSNNAAENFATSSYYKYNLDGNILTKLTMESNVDINFLAIQGMTCKDGYLYQVVTNPNQILKAKITEDKIIFESIYNLPNKDNLGLLIGEYEGIDFIDDNNMIISSHILDDNLTGRTIKTYLLNLKNNVPMFLKHYPSINMDNYNSDIQRDVYLDSMKNPTVYYETGNNKYPFKTLARAINYCQENNQVSLMVYNNVNAGTSDIVYKMETIPNNTNIYISIKAEHIEIDIKRILSSNIVFDSAGSPSGVNTSSFVNFLSFDGSISGTIVNSIIKFICNLHLNSTLEVHKSTIFDISKIYSTITSPTYMIRIRRNSVYYSNTTWTSTNSNDKYFIVHDGGTLFVNNVSSNQSTWYSTHVTNSGSSAYNVIFAGVHYSA